MLKLIQILFDIALLRRGPQDLPNSWLILYVTLALWIGGGLLAMLVLTGGSLAAFSRDIVGWLASLALFATIVSIAGHSGRVLQTVSAIAGAGAVIVLCQVFSDLVSILLSNDGNLLVRDLLLLWAVFVKGYILAAAIEVHAMIGILLSVAVFVARLAISQSLPVS